MSDDEDSDIMRDAIAKVSGEGTFVTRYVVLAEVIGTDGVPRVSQISDCDFTYQIFGFMQHGMERARARYHGWDSE